MTPEDIKEIKVDLFGFEKAYSPDILYSGGLGPCIAIGVFDPLTKSGYMMHSPGFQICNPPLEERIEEIREDCDNLSRLLVFATGCALEYDDYPNFRKFKIDGRTYAEQTLRRYFSDSQLTINWTPDNHCGGLFLDTSTGKFELDNIRLDELQEEYAK